MGKLVLTQDLKVKKLKLQLYGKEDLQTPKLNKGSGATESSLAFKTSLPLNIISQPTNSLKKDLLKTIFLATILLFMQIAIFVSLERGVLKF